jgi:protein-disulfide isomerase
LPLTRRHFIAASGAAVVFAAAGGGYWWLNLDRGREAATLDIDPAELSKAPPLADMVLGLANAPVTIIEYASMTCSHCAEFHRTVFPQLKAQYIDAGKVRFVFREFPLEIKAATCSMLARCIGKDDARRFHAAVDALFAAQDDLVAKDTVSELQRIGRLAGMSDDAFNACMADQRMLAQLQEGRDHAYEKLKVNSTPTFFINGTRLVGALPFEAFSGVIEKSVRA